MLLPEFFIFRSSVLPEIRPSNSVARVRQGSDGPLRSTRLHQGARSARHSARLCSPSTFGGIYFSLQEQNKISHKYQNSDAVG